MIKIEQDGFYLNAIGEIVHIEIRIDGIPEDDNGFKYQEDGSYTLNSDYDLIGYIPPELHYSILKTINNYHKNEDYKRFIDKEFKKELNEKR